MRVYHSLVRSHVCFCSQVWAPQSAVNNLFLVEGIQRRTSRFIVGKGSDLSYRDHLIKLRLLPLNYWLEYLDLVFFYKCLNNLVDFTFEFDHYFSFVQGRTRSADTAHCLTAVTRHTRPTTIFFPFHKLSFGGRQSNVSMTIVVFISCQFHGVVRSSLDQI